MVGTMGKYDPDMGGVEIGPRGGPGDPVIFWTTVKPLLCFALLCFALLSFLTFWRSGGPWRGHCVLTTYARARAVVPTPTIPGWPYTMVVPKRPAAARLVGR